MTETTLFLPGLSPVGGKTITATFDGGTLSSNGGVLILREIEKKLGLATVLSRHIPDDRDGRRVRHSYRDMTRARMFAIASGHEDCDDLDVLRSDPALKMACGRLARRSSASRLSSTPRSSSPISGSENIGIFSTDMDSFDFTMRRPEQVIKSVLAKLQKHGKGIVLMHDFPAPHRQGAPRAAQPAQGGRLQDRAHEGEGAGEDDRAV
jgi:hypothetical protein